jgi:hypothetical protein
MSVYTTGFFPGGNSKVNQFNQFFYDAYRTWGVYYAAAYRDLRAYAGDNWTQQEKTMLEKQRRMILELNKIRRVINLFSGYERENRTSTVVEPIEGSDRETADLFSDVMMYVYAKAQSEYIFSEAFEHSLKTGLAIIGIYIDYQNDKVNGDLKFYWKPFNALMLDPYFTRRDLGDCDQASTRDLLSRDQVKALLPWVPEDVIDNIPTGIRDNKYQYLGIYRQYNSTYIAKNLLTYDQYWKRINKAQKFIVDMETGVSQEWDGSPEEEKILLEEISKNPRVQLINSHKRSVELNIIVGGKLLYEGPDPTGLDTFPFIPVIAYHEPLIDTYELKIQGVVRSIRDAQRQYNRRHSQIIDLMESIINTGFIHKNGAVLDPDMLFQSGQGRNIVVNPEFDVQSDIKEISPPNIPPGYLQYQDIMDRNIMEIPGGSDELLGLSSTGDIQVSGKLAEVRASNGLKGNRGLFDNFEYAQKLFGDLTLQCIQKNFTPGKVWRITGKQPTPQFFSGQFEQYDALIKSAVKTQTQREAYYFQLLQLRSLGIYVSDEDLIDAAPLQGGGPLREKAAQMSKQKMEVQQLELEDRKIKNMQIMAQADQSVALAQERRARVLSDIGLARERISEGEQNYAKALLDNAKTVSEMHKNRNDSVMEAVRLAMEMSQMAKERSNETLGQDAQVMESLKQQSEEAAMGSMGQPAGQGGGQEIYGGQNG